MAILEIVINSKVYQIGCDKNEEKYVKSMVNDLNKRINKLKQQDPVFFNKLQDERLFLYQLLLLCSEINDLKKQKKIDKQIDKQTFDDKEIHRMNVSINNLKKSLQYLDSLIKQ